jgi:hypothetical protein
MLGEGLRLHGFNQCRATIELAKGTIKLFPADVIFHRNTYHKNGRLLVRVFENIALQAR